MLCLLSSDCVDSNQSTSLQAPFLEVKPLEYVRLFLLVAYIENTLTLDFKWQGERSLRKAAQLPVAYTLESILSQSNLRGFFEVWVSECYEPKSACVYWVWSARSGVCITSFMASARIRIRFDWLTQFWFLKAFEKLDPTLPLQYVKFVLGTFWISERGSAVIHDSSHSFSMNSSPLLFELAWRWFSISGFGDPYRDKVHSVVDSRQDLQHLNGAVEMFTRNPGSDRLLQGVNDVKKAIQDSL